jgi:hypothetical protein
MYLNFLSGKNFSLIFLIRHLPAIKPVPEQLFKGNPAFQQGVKNSF